MPNYQNGKIYKICSYNSDDVYYGSTCLKLCQRLAKHVSDWKLFKQGKAYAVTMTSYFILEQGNYYIELVETVPCSSKEELHIRERFWLKNNPCVNLIKNPKRTIEEINRYELDWRASNKKAVQKWKSDWKVRNQASLKEYILCDCGRYCKRQSLHSHVKTDVHKENINRVMFSQFLDL